MPCNPVVTCNRSNPVTGQPSLGYSGYMGFTGYIHYRSYIHRKRVFPSKPIGSEIVRDARQDIAGRRDGPNSPLSGYSDGHTGDSTQVENAKKPINQCVFDFQGDGCIARSECFHG